MYECYLLDHQVTILRTELDTSLPCTILIWLGLQLWMFSLQFFQYPRESNASGTKTCCIWLLSNYCKKKAMKTWNRNQGKNGCTLRKCYLPKVISWIDKEHRGLYVSNQLLRKKTLPLQSTTNNYGLDYKFILSSNITIEELYHKFNCWYKRARETCLWLFHSCNTILVQTFGYTLKNDDISKRCN